MSTTDQPSGTWRIDCGAGLIPEGQGEYATESAAQDVMRLHSGACAGTHAVKFIQEPADAEAGPHCYHHQHDSRCWEEYDGDCGGDDDDDCVHCPCCCTCLSCEYGPQDGRLMYPSGAPWAADGVADGTTSA